jgi:hypothetical protein
MSHKEPQISQIAQIFLDVADSSVHVTQYRMNICVELSSICEICEICG